MKKEEFKEFFKEAFEPYATSIAGDFNRIGEELVIIRGELASAKEERASIKAILTQLFTRVDRIEVEIAEVKKGIRKIWKEMVEIKRILADFQKRDDLRREELAGLESRVDKLEERVFS